MRHARPARLDDTVFVGIQCVIAWSEASTRLYVGSRHSSKDRTQKKKGSENAAKVTEGTKTFILGRISKTIDYISLGSDLRIIAISRLRFNSSYIKVIPTKRTRVGRGCGVGESKRNAILFAGVPEAFPSFNTPRVITSHHPRRCAQPTSWPQGRRRCPTRPARRSSP